MRKVELIFIYQEKWIFYHSKSIDFTKNINLAKTDFIIQFFRINIFSKISFSALKHSPSKRQGKRDSIKKVSDATDNATSSNPAAGQTSTSGGASAVTVSHGNGKIFFLLFC